MLGKDECADADEHDEGREYDAVLVGSKNGFLVYVLADASLGHEDCIVIALTKNESGKDDVDDIEFNAEQGHDAKNPHPTDSHREEGYDGEFDATEREPEEEEYDERTCPTYVVEVVGK